MWSTLDKEGLMEDVDPMLRVSCTLYLEIRIKMSTAVAHLTKYTKHKAPPAVGP